MNIFSDQKTCKGCNLLYAVEFSMHQDYCDDCFRDCRIIATCRKCKKPSYCKFSESEKMHICIKCFNKIEIKK